MRPYILLKAAVSLDGYIDNAREERLILSNSKDLQAVDLLRSEYDAILVGANTIRKDNPSLVCKTSKHQPIKITITNSGNIDIQSNFFQIGEAKKIIFTSQQSFSLIHDKFKNHATVLAFNDLDGLLNQLYQLGIKKLMIEGGGNVLTQFLAAALFDIFRLAICPVIVANNKAVKLVDDKIELAKLKIIESQQLESIQVILFATEH